MADDPYLSVPSVPHLPRTPGAGSVDKESFRHIAYFVSAHGFGHATRAAAVMAAVHALDPAICFEVFTAAPEFLFRASLTGPFVYHHGLTDIGLVQRSALVEDPPATLARLDDFLPFDEFLLRSWADWLGRLECELVICDIAPLGLAVAELAGLPSVLIERSAGDWIYDSFGLDTQCVRRLADTLR